MITITDSATGVEPEPLKTPFGFKGGYLTELWQSVVRLTDADGNAGLGLGTQSVLWSDASVFAANSETDGNRLMLQVTEYAAELVRGMSFETPLDLLEQILPECYVQAQMLAGPKVRLTFVLNALVPLDNAAWMLYAHANGITSFDAMIPRTYRQYLTARHEELGSIPLFSYGTNIAAIKAAVDQGTFFAKIKIGADPDSDGDPEKMLSWDRNRLTEIHNGLKDKTTPFTDSGHIPYYLDANCRYADKDQLLRFLDHADGIGALDRILFIEEPFPEEYREPVDDLPVTLAADESLHSVAEANERLDLGYGILTLKPIAKTLSMTLQTLAAAAERDVPCFCADLTVNPILVEWNKNVAARLEPLRGLKIPLMETNGAQNYANWQAMASYHPQADADWIDDRDGHFTLTDEFYNGAAGTLAVPRHYDELLDA